MEPISERKTALYNIICQRKNKFVNSATNNNINIIYYCLLCTILTD